MVVACFFALVVGIWVCEYTTVHSFLCHEAIACLLFGDMKSVYTQEWNCGVIGV